MLYASKNKVKPKFWRQTWGLASISPSQYPSGCSAHPAYPSLPSKSLASEAWMDLQDLQSTTESSLVGLGWLRNKVWQKSISVLCITYQKALPGRRCTAKALSSLLGTNMSQPYNSTSVCIISCFWTNSECLSRRVVGQFSAQIQRKTSHWFTDQYSSQSVLSWIESSHLPKAEIQSSNTQVEIFECDLRTLIKLLHSIRILADPTIPWSGSLWRYFF